jgi:hypothetical protein
MVAVSFIAILISVYLACGCLSWRQRRHNIPQDVRDPNSLAVYLHRLEFATRYELPCHSARSCSPAPEVREHSSHRVDAGRQLAGSR